MTMSIFTKIASTLLLLGSMPMAFAITIQYTGEQDSDSSVELKVYCPDENTTVDGSGNKKNGESCWKADYGTSTTFYNKITMSNKGSIKLPSRSCLLTVANEGNSPTQNYVCVLASQGTIFTTTNPLKEESDCTISFESIKSGNGIVEAPNCGCKSDNCKKGSGYANPLYRGPTITAPSGAAVKITTNESHCAISSNNRTLLNYSIEGPITNPVVVKTYLSESVDQSLCIYYGNTVGGTFNNDEGCKITISDKMTGKNNFTFEGCGPAKQ